MSRAFSSFVDAPAAAFVSELPEAVCPGRRAPSAAAERDAGDDREHDHRRDDGHSALRRHRRRGCRPVVDTVAERANRGRGRGVVVVQLGIRLVVDPAALVLELEIVQ